MIEVRGLSKTFVSGLFRRRKFTALQNVSLAIESGRTLGLVGHSGSGKSTLARCMTRLIPADCGAVLLDGEDVLAADSAGLKRMRRKIQIVFQHPYSALNPRRTLEASITEPLLLHGLGDRRGREEIVSRQLSLVSLHPEVLNRYPHQVSGGQLQRAVIARALCLDPSVLILDEPTSMLDISVQATILNLLQRLQRELGLTYLFITHDEKVVEFMSHSIVELEAGRVKRVAERAPS